MAQVQITDVVVPAEFTRLIYFIAGVTMLLLPVNAVFALTLVLACYIAVEGAGALAAVFRLIPTVRGDRALDLIAARGCAADAGCACERAKHSLCADGYGPGLAVVLFY